MALASAEMLSHLGSGLSIEKLCELASMTRDQFLAWWRAEIRARVPESAGTRRLFVRDAVRIERDEWGVPHIHATNDQDLFFGFGYAMAQDRLFQLDYLRRKAAGRLAEILGPEAVESDLVARIVGLRRIAEAEWDAAPGETRTLLTAFSAGINALAHESARQPPIEFDLLQYQPETWSPVDSLAIAGEFRWYLTGRFPVIVCPELARRTLGTGPLYEAFLRAEADSESILPAGTYPRQRSGVGPVGFGVNDPDGAQGSNNWVLAGSRTSSGHPLVASDPHIAMGAVSCWYQVHLQGGSFQVAGMAYAGMPAVMFGRNQHVAWGITNNICSQRDLYQERTDPAHPDSFLFDGAWEPVRRRQEVIHVKGAPSIDRMIRFSRNGPIVDEILPAAARSTGPVSLKWLGTYPCGWMTALLAMDRAQSASDLADATRPWRVPTFSVVYADTKGRIGYQCTGRIPVRGVAERGYRPGWLPEHQWSGLISFEGMPRLADPAQGFVATANNRVAADDFPYPLSGTWSSGQRGQRIREWIEQKTPLSREDSAALQQDALSLRAKECVPRLIAALGQSAAPRLAEVARTLQAWDGHMEPDRVGASIFNVFFNNWCRTVAQQRFQGDEALLLAGAIGGLAADLLQHDPAGWFASGRVEAIATTMLATLEELTHKLGPDLSQWSWGRLHYVVQRHFLSSRGSLGELLDRIGPPVKGDGVTVCNTGADPTYQATMGAGYRLLAELDDPAGGLWAIDAGSQSGHPGSPHYDDQLGDWLGGRYHFLSLSSPAQVRGSVLTLEPQSA